MLAVAASGLTACAGGDDIPSGGIGGSGTVAQGTITGFGSIYVNGVEFETDMAEVEINEQSATEDDLRLGMVVTIAGNVNDDEVSGTASNVFVDNVLRGPVSVVNPPDTDDVTRTVEILGYTVTLSRNDTQFEDITFDAVIAGDLVEVSGFLTSQSAILATRLRRNGVVVPGSSEVELSGTVSNYVTDTSFTLGAITITLDATTVVSGPALANGQLVEVEGVVLAGLTTVLAREIEPEDGGLPDDADEVEIEGIVTDFTDIGNFKVANLAVDASSAEFEPAALANTLALGDRVEVEGDIVNGVLVADEVKGRSGNIRIEAYVNNVDVGAGEVMLELAPGQLVTIGTSASTIFKDDRDEVPNFGLADLVAGDYVRIQADVTTSIVANEIQRKGIENKIKITAVVEATTFADPDGTVSLLGITFNTDGSTDFERDAEPSDMAISATQFFGDAQVTAGTAVITLEDEADPPAMVGDGIADEVEIKD